ncbi:MAG: hypothetical protein P8Z79_18730 [Sedimentisphaerales bacterium]
MKNLNDSSIWSLNYFSLFLCTVISTVLVMFYLYSISPYIMLPADILMWAETNFVGDIIKIRIGAPFYTDPADSNSGIYTFGAPYVTYAISWLFGKSTSIPAWRSIQLLFISGAAMIGTACCCMLCKHAFPDYRNPFPKTWLAFIFLALFLVGTAPRANVYSHCLHAEALALLISTVSFWAMLRYLKSPSWTRLFFMAALPSLGFMVKQVLLCWSAVMFIFLLLHDPKSIIRLIVFFVSVIVFFAITIGICYWIWGSNFFFWTFDIMGGVRKLPSFSTTGFRVSLPRSLDHTIRLWPEIAVGVLGGYLLCREKRNIAIMAPVWVAWISLILIEAYTSGVGWSVLWHFGPGVFIASILLFSVLPRFWPNPGENRMSTFSALPRWTNPLLAITGIMTLFVILHVVPSADKYEIRYYRRHPSPDVYRYISDIEHEFEGFSPDKVLLDIGNWIYFAIKHTIRYCFMTYTLLSSYTIGPTGKGHRG